MLININSKSARRSLLTVLSTTQGWVIAAVIVVLMVGIRAYDDVGDETSSTTTSKPDSKAVHEITDTENYPAERTTLSGVSDVHNLSALRANTDNHTIEWAEPYNGTVTTLAGQAGLDGNVDGVGSKARLYCPQTVALSPEGSFTLVADYCNDAIRQIDLASGVVTTIVEQSDFVNSTVRVRTKADFNRPLDKVIAPDGIYLCLGNQLQ